MDLNLHKSTDEDLNQIHGLRDKILKCIKHYFILRDTMGDKSATDATIESRILFRF